MLRFTWSFYATISKYDLLRDRAFERLQCSRTQRCAGIRCKYLGRGDAMADLVDIAIPANAQAAAEALCLKVQRSVTSGARVRQIPRDEAEIAVECLRDWGISARILEDTPRSERPAEYDATPAR